MAKKKATRTTATRKRSAKKRPARGQQSLPIGPVYEAPPTKTEHAAQTALVRKILTLKRRGRAAYKEAETLMEELVAEAGTGSEYDLGKGRTGVIVDNFARRSTVFKTTGFDRYAIEVLE